MPALTDTVGFDTNGLGHQKALVASLVAPGITIIDQVTLMAAHIPIPDKLETAAISLLSGLAVWFAPHGR